MPLAGLPIVATIACADNSAVTNTQYPSEPPVLPDVVPKPEPEQIFNPDGGTIAGLQVDRYLKVVQALGLSSSTEINRLTNQILTHQLRTHGGEQAQKAAIQIQAGSTGKQTLVLRLIRPDQADVEITITGFQIWPVYFQYSSFTFDLSQWIAHLMPIVTSANLATAIDQTTSATWNTLIGNAWIKIIDKTTGRQERLVRWSELKEQGFNFTIKAQLAKNTTDQVQFRIQTHELSFTYDKLTQSWTSQTASTPIQQVIPASATGSIFTQQQVAQFLLDQTALNPQILAQNYPSQLKAISKFYTAAAQSGTGVFNIPNLLTNPHFKEGYNLADEQLKRTYFANEDLKLVIPSGDYNFQVNDFNNTLEVNVICQIGEEPNYAISKLLKAQNQTKDLQALNLEQIQSQAVVKPSGTLHNQLLKHLKTNPAVSPQIEAFFNQQQAPNFTNPILINASQLINPNWKFAYEPQRDYNELAQQFRKLNEQFTFSLFNQALKIDPDLSPSIADSYNFNWQTGLFIYTDKANAKHEFSIQTFNLDYKKDAQNNLELNLKAIERQIVVEFAAIVELNLYGRSINHIIQLQANIRADQWNKKAPR